MGVESRAIAGWPRLRTASVSLLPGLFPPSPSTLETRVRRALLSVLIIAATFGAVAWISFGHDEALRWPIASALVLSLVAAAVPWHRVADGAFTVVGVAAGVWVAYAVWVTGGADSPLTPIAVVPVVLLVLDAPRRVALPLALAFSLVPALPFAYGATTPAQVAHLATLVGMCAGLAIVGAMLMREIHAFVEEDRHSAMRSDHYAMVAHELRNPLIGINAMSRVLGLRLHDSAHATHISAMAAETQAALALLDDLSDVAAIETGRLRLTATRIDLSAIVRRLVDAMRSGEHPIVLSGADDALMVLSDERGVAQILRNLLSNAAKFSPDGAATLVTVSVERQGAIVSVRDGGAGIPPDERSRLFQKFTRLSTAGGTRGSGLGLYLSRRMARDLSGDLWAEWPEGGGSIFKLSLPMPEPS